MACKPDLENLTIDVDQCVESGAKTRAFLGYSSEVATWPTEPTSAVLGTNVTYVDPLVMSSGNQLWEIHSDVDGINYSFEKLANGTRNTVTINRAGLEPKIIGLLDRSNRKHFVLLVEDKNGDLRQLGEEGNPCTIPAYEGTTGNTIEDDTNTLITFQFDGPFARYYTGAVPVTPAP